MTQSSRLLLLSLFVALCAAQQTVGTSHSQATMQPGTPFVLFNLTQSSTPSAMTYIWLTSGAASLPNVTISYYVDGEASPSVSYQYYLASGLAFGGVNSPAPWGTSLFGKGAAAGSVWNMIRVPFATSITVVCQLPESETSAQGFYAVVRGVVGLKEPLLLGSIALPTTARLHTVQQLGVVLQPLEFLWIVNATQAGALLSWTFAAQSANENFLEGCVRAYPAGDASKMWLMSSGTEDYFQSGWYFSAGSFQWDSAGLTWPWGGPAFNGEIAAYKVHVDDPFVWGDDGMSVSWRNGDTNDPSTGLKCTLLSGTPAGNPQVSTLDVVAFVYLW